MSNEKVLNEARERFRVCQSKESSARANWRQDTAFCYADSVGLEQWTGDTVDARNASGKPCFTINRTKVYCNALIGDSLNNKAELVIKPVGGGASFQAAEVLEGIVRHIDAASNSQLSYEKAVREMITGGVGYWRIVTDFEDDESFNQSIFIRPCDALNVYLDPFAQMPDGSDAEYGFVFTDVDKREFGKTYPKFREVTSEAPLGAWDIDGLAGNWEDDKRMRICEYYRKLHDEDVLHYLEDGSMVKESDAKEQDLLEAVRERSIRKRDISVPKVEWYLICGNSIADHNIWPSKYIPIIKCVGEEINKDGVIDRISMTRGLIDSQRSLNYYVSAGIEYVAAQSKSPWIASVESISGTEEYWRDANIRNYSVLPYNARTDDGTELAPPSRADPPVYAAAFLDGQKLATEEMELVSGMPPAMLGDTSNERSGKAVEARQRSAQNTTAHFVNGFSNAVRYSGRILLDLIPKIFDVERTLKVLAQDGTLHTVQINPNQQDAHQTVQGLDQESISPDQIAATLNPSVGTYMVVAECGPQFTTRREQFVSALMDILAQNESLAPVVADLAFRNMDFQGASEIADRLRRMVPPQALGIVDPQVQQLQQQLAMQHQVINDLQHQVMQAKSKAESISYQKEIDVFEAVTDRMKVMGGIDPAAIRPIIREEVSKIIGIPANQAIAMHMHEDSVMTKTIENEAAAMNAAHQQLQEQEAPPPVPQ